MFGLVVVLVLKYYAEFVILEVLDQLCHVINVLVLRLVSVVVRIDLGQKVKLVIIILLC